MKNKTAIKTKTMRFYLIVFFAAVAVYANTSNHDFVLDDDVVFRQNKYVQEGVSAIPEILTHGFLFGYNQKNDQSYRPLVLINFALDKSLFGNNPKALHKLSILYYALMCCLLFTFLNLLFKKEKPWIALWVTLLFVVHPVHTEVVANIKGRDEVLHAIFLILSFIYVLKYIDIKKSKDLGISLLAFFAALLCKEMAVTYMVLMPLTVWVFRSIEIKKLGLLSSFYAGVLLLYFILRNSILDVIAFEEKMSVINNGLAAAENYPDQLATTFLIFANYIKLLFIPHPLAWDYSFPHFEIVSFTNPIVILVILVLLAAGIFSLVKLPSKNQFAYTFIFFIASFSIVSNFFILIGCTLGERFLFFPSIAYCLFLVLVLEKLIGLLKIKSKNALAIGVIIISVSYAFTTIDRNEDWANNYALFISGAEATPNNSRAISAIGSMNRELGEQSRNQAQQQEYYKKAIASYKRSIELLPSNTDSYYNLGVIYMAVGQNKTAQKYFEDAIGLEPNHLSAHNNLGVIYFKDQNFNEALKLFLRCTEINPNFQNAIANLGAVYHNLGDLEKAKSYYVRALELNPNDVNSRNNLNKLN